MTDDVIKKIEQEGNMAAENFPMTVKLVFLVTVDRVWGYGRKININAI